MAYQASDGKKFTNRPPMKAHEASLSAKKQNPLQAPGEPDGDEQGAEQVAAEHGPAREVHITHDHAMGSHHVHSVHDDGHEHHSDHGSAEEAHEHGKKLAAGQSEPDGDEGMGGGEMC